VITLTGSVQCWGSNSKGQLGQPVNILTQNHLPQTITGLTAKVIRSGYNHVCAIAGDNSVKCWGDNLYGQLGNVSNIDSEIPVAASGLAGVVALSSGAYHNCAATASAISCWGRNNAGQLGSNGTADLNLPVQTATVRANVTQLAAGLSHSCALHGSTVECWGGNANLQLSGNSAGGVGFIAVALTNSPRSIAAGLNHTCVQDSSNLTYCWGAGTLGRLGPNANVDSANPIQVP
jgi:alpha-tubulin suppressor-like RCC1 family protein